VKDADQESGGELIVRNFRFGPFLQSKSANNVRKLFRHLGDFRATDSLGYSPQMKIPGGATKYRLLNSAGTPETHFT